MPAGNESRDSLADDGLSKDGPTEDIPDGSVGREPHFLETKLDDTLLVGSDCCTFDGNIMLESGESRVDGDLAILNSIK